MVDRLKKRALQKNTGQAFGHSQEFPRLLADIGGTIARFVLEMEDGRLEALSILQDKHFPTIGDALRTYLSQSESIAAGAGQVRHAAFAIANSVDGDEVQLTNADWAFSIEALRREFRLETLLLVNDFTALAVALPALAQDEIRQFGGGVARSGYPIALLGAGTGLGVSALIPSENGWVPLQAEGGHASFSPADEREAEILRFAWKTYSHVSAERLLSGDGLTFVYQALAHLNGVTPEGLSAPAISQRALVGACALCNETLEVFFAMLGTFAGNLALTLGAKGGVYIGGGIVPRLQDRFAASKFRQRFEQKGRFAAYLADIPVFLITAEYPAFRGVSVMLSQKLASKASAKLD